MPEPSALYLGLISGTSVDGIDVALASFDSKPKLLCAYEAAYPADLRKQILALAQGDGAIALDEFGALDVEIGRAFGHAAMRLLQREGISAKAIRAIGSHGQTVRHRPLGNAPYTLQLGDANVIAEITGITTVADFRRRDIAAGGQGAPLAPLFHAAMFAHAAAPRVVLNLGGIANITILPDATHPTLRGFDTGPASCLLDAWSTLQWGQPYDVDGAFAASGKVDARLLERLLADDYFKAPPPKSTGREIFHLPWLETHLRDLNIAPNDVQATLVALTAQSISAAIDKYAAVATEVLVCGGGVHNPVLLRALAEAIPQRRVRSVAELGVDPNFVEAMLFAWLARERLENHAPRQIESVTGARNARVLGAIYSGR